jgi:nitrogen fixation protein FixH
VTESVNRAVQAVAAALFVAVVVALLLAFVSLLWTALMGAACALLYLASRRFGHRLAKRRERQAQAEAQAAQLAALQAEQDRLAALNREVERRQFKVIEEFRREHGLT